MLHGLPQEPFERYKAFLEWYEVFHDQHGKDEMLTEDKMVFLGGSKIAFKCECGCNVFRLMDELKYKCNSCGVTYTGEPLCLI